MVIPFFGRGKAFALAILFLIAGDILMGSLYYVFNHTLFIILAIVSRLLQGAETSLAITLGFALLSVAFPQSI